MNFTLNVLGTASALPTTERYPSAQVLNVRGRLFMIDCGEGAQIQMRKAGISFLKIEHICLSHIHGDHIFGLFGLLSTMAMLGRTAPLNIYAPGNFLPILEVFKSNFGEGILYEINYVALDVSEPTVIYENRTVELLAFPLNHRVPTFGFLIREKMPKYNVSKKAIAEYGLSIAEIGALKRGEDVVRPAGYLTEACAENDYKPQSGSDQPMVIPFAEAAYLPFQPRSYAYCSDTAYLKSIVPQIKGVDLLFHEGTFAQCDAARAKETYHTTAEQAAEIALEAEAKQLVIGHFSARYEDESILLKEAQAIFPSTLLAKENLRITL